MIKGLAWFDHGVGSGDGREPPCGRDFAGQYGNPARLALSGFGNWGACHVGQWEEQDDVGAAFEAPGHQDEPQQGWPTASQPARQPMLQAEPIRGGGTLCWETK